MTQVDVRAVFSDGDQRSDSVGIFYYTGSSTSSSTGGSTSIKILDAILVADVNTSLANRDISISTLTNAPSQDSDDVPDDVETVVNLGPSQTPFSWIILLLIGLAVAAFLAWLLVRKRHAFARQFKN